MNREEKILMAIDKGITCNPETGEVFGVKGNINKPHKGKPYNSIVFTYNKKSYSISEHQFIYYWFHKKCVDFIDHKDGNSSNNKIDNLRSVTHQQNMFNSKAKGYTHRKKENKWVSRIMVNGENKTIGRYDTEEEARQAYLEAKKIYHII